MRKAAIVCDNYKVERFKKTLTEKGFKILSEDVYSVQDKLTSLVVQLETAEDTIKLAGILTLLEKTKNLN